MNTPKTRQLGSCACLALALLACGTALADDTEIFFNNLNGGANANVMFVLDSSGSMNDVVTTQAPYDSTVSYNADKCASDFDANYVYYGKGGTVPACGSAQSIAVKNFACTDAAAALSTNSGSAAPGFYSGSPMIEWGPYTFTTGKGKGKVTTTTEQWQGTLGVTGGTTVECKADAGVTANGRSGGTSLWPSKSSNAASTVGVYDTAVNSWWNVTGNVGASYVIYSANYLNYYYNSKSSTTNTKVAILQQGMKAILDSVNNINVGLMRYDSGGAGGMVLDPILPIATNEASLLSYVNSDAPSGTTPISETLYEAYLYFSGGPVYFGNKSKGSTCSSWATSLLGLYTCSKFSSTSQPSVPASRSTGTAAGTNYASPANSSCQRNYVVFLTDGLPNSDSKANSLIQGLPGFAKAGAACYANSSAMYSALGQPAVPSGTDGTGLCSAAIAKYMYGTDMRKDVSAVQNVTTYMIGFGNDFADSNGAPTGAFAYLQDIAKKGGGEAYTATSLSDLTSVFNQILASVVKTNTLFSAPAVAVNAFNRTQTLNDLYVSVFSPKTTFHWPGNMKKYKVVGGQVVDANGAPAVDPATGFFVGTAQSFWSPVVDGYDVTLGGAAANIPNYATRKVYTFIGTNPGGSGAALAKSSAYSFDQSNTALTAVNLAIGGTGDPAVADLVNWARGQDLLDENQDGSTSDMRQDMGDPIHTAPALAVYGKNGDGTNNMVAYVPTNDGYLHAVNANTGAELWAFIPQEMLPHLVDLYTNQPSLSKHYGIDGAITVLTYDVNGDGTIDASAGDRVILYFSTGRNTDTSTYYAMDVTDQASPVLLWSINGGTLPGLGQAWSQPQITRVKIAGAAQNSQRLVLVIGGGYDPSEDGYGYVPSDVVGNHLYMVDALYGTLLWDAGNVSGYNLVSARMDHAIPSSVAVMDLNGDGYADRMYVGDMAGQVWRFDITNGQPAGTLVAGAVIASLGTKEDSVHRAAATRRFYSAPDVSAVQKPGVAAYLNVAIGSGYRGHPLDLSADDRFYTIRDTSSPFAAMTPAQFSTLPLIRDAEITGPASLIDITASVTPTLPAGSRGWQLDLNQYGGWRGEKVLSQSTTFNNTVIFTTYAPSSVAVTDPCSNVGAGTNRVYQVSVFDGSPKVDTNKDGSVTTLDRARDLAQSGIAPQVTLLFLPDTSNPKQTDIVLMSGAETIGVMQQGTRIKTYWREGAAN